RNPERSRSPTAPNGRASNSAVTMRVKLSVKARSRSRSIPTIKRTAKETAHLDLSSLRVRSRTTSSRSRCAAKIRPTWASPARAAARWRPTSSKERFTPRKRRRTSSAKRPFRFIGECDFSSRDRCDAGDDQCCGEKRARRRRLIELHPREHSREERLQADVHGDERRRGLAERPRVEEVRDDRRHRDDPRD